MKFTESRTMNAAVTPPGSTESGQHNREAAFSNPGLSDLPHVFRFLQSAAARLSCRSFRFFLSRSSRETRRERLIVLRTCSMQCDTPAKPAARGGFCRKSRINMCSPGRRSRCGRSAEFHDVPKESEPVSCPTGSVDFCLLRIRSLTSPASSLHCGCHHQSRHASSSAQLLQGLLRARRPPYWQLPFRKPPPSWPPDLWRPCRHRCRP
jgi:hypothetical protein